MTLSCRLCSMPLSRIFVDLGETPLANSYATSIDETQPVYPLKVYVCDSCLLVQLHHQIPPQAIFGDYAYFSSYSSTWLAHAKAFAERMTQELNLNTKSRVIEIASNDGYLLRNFVAKNIPCLGIEPAANVARVAIEAGVPTEVAFLNRDFASQLTSQNKKADLLIANNVIAHVPDLNDFVASLAMLLQPDGVLSIEFPHLLQLIATNAFDTIYHEHYSYFSLWSLDSALKKHGLRIFAAENLSTHGGSLRVLACRKESNRQAPSLDLESIRKRETEAKLDKPEGYGDFASQVSFIKNELRDFIARSRQAGHRVAAYGAAAKGNTLLNVCGINHEQVDFVVDKNPAKQGRFLPGSKIPIFSPEKIFTKKPDIVLILPWNIADEIREDLKDIRAWGGRFVTAVPRLQVWDA